MSEKNCPFCGETVKMEAVKCKHCQSNLTGNAPATGTGVNAESLHWAWFIPAFLIPIVGVIIAIVGFIQKKTNAAHMLAFSFASWIFWILVFL